MPSIAQNSKDTQNFHDLFRGLLLGWYDENARELPWRAPPGGEQAVEPYHVWLSEIMLQQTTVPAVIPYFLKFLEIWPRVEDLAAAPQEDVMREWAGLGYYARARNLHKCAGVIAGQHGGVFPRTQEALRALPGVGEYTSAAIAAIAFGENATVVDGNIERVLARIHSVQEALPGAKKALKVLAAPYFESGERPGDLAQALMDLGSSVCTAKAPKCLLCPVRELCEGHAQGIAAELPRKAPKAAKPQKYGHVYWITNAEGQVLTETRPERGMLGGMRGFPTSDWYNKSNNINNSKSYINVSRETFLGQVRHSFTHFDLTLDIYGSSTGHAITLEGHQSWIDIDRIAQAGLPTLFKKVLKFTLSS